MTRRRTVPRPTAGARPVRTGTATLVPDDDGRRGWTLYLNGMESSHVDLDDPTRLDFEYIRWVVAGIECHREASERDLSASDHTHHTHHTDQDDDAQDVGRAVRRVLHLGGGGCTLPRYLAATEPAVRQVVVELDEGVLELTKQAFGLRSGPSMRLRVGEARQSLTGEPVDHYDVVVRDAFTGSTVPGHLMTRQFVAEVDRVLRPDGLYLANLADGQLLATARREAATALAVFRHVAMVAEPGQLHGRRYGNVVFAASQQPLPVQRWARRLAGDPVRARLLDVEEVRAFASGRRPFEDQQPFDEHDPFEDRTAFEVSQD